MPTKTNNIVLSELLQIPDDYFENMNQSGYYEHMELKISLEVVEKMIIIFSILGY